MNLDLLFDTPWWLPVGLAVVGVAVWVSGNRRRDSALMNIGYVAVGLAIIVVAISWFVMTDREKAEAATRSFVQAVVDQDLDTARAVLDPRAHVNVLGGATQYASRDQVIAAVDQADERFGLKSATITGLQSQVEGPLITVTFDILSQQDKPIAYPFTSGWQFEYQHGAEGLKLWRITLVRLGQGTPQQAQDEFPTVPR